VPACLEVVRELSWKAGELDGRFAWLPGAGGGICQWLARRAAAAMKNV
jgi:hypothetical protein